jgi:type II secretory pathway component PulC
VPVGSEPRAPATAGSPLAAFRFAGLGPAGGLRLARVRAGTLPAALGLRSGDELVSVNDFKLGDPEQALTAYARLRSAERLRLAVIRDGARTELVYFIR